MGEDGNEPSRRKAREGLKVNIRTLGIDLAKNVFRVHGVDANGKILVARQLRRRQLLPFIAQLKPCLVVMEACGGAHHFAREIARHGHEVKLMSPRFVRPYVKSNKNDARDAEAICEAVTRLPMRFVVVKSQAQQDILALHRVRALLIRERTALMNQMRGLLAEEGIVLRWVQPHCVGHWPSCRTMKTARPPLLARDTGEMSERLRLFEERLKGYDSRITGFARNDQVVRLMAVEGVGPITAPALVATVGDARQFRTGRELSAWLGLTPRQYSSGERTVLLGISKRGDRYLRTLLIHGARSALYYAARRHSRRSEWLEGVRKRRGTNIAAVALANKNARVLWALLRRAEYYRVRLAA
jgi:transposase